MPAKIIYKKSTGQLLCFRHLSNESEELNPIGIDEDFLDGELFQFKNNSYFDGEKIITIPARPSVLHNWDWMSKIWLDTALIEDRRDSKWNEIKTARATAITAKLTTPYGIFDADPASSLNIIKAVLLAQTLVNAGEPVAIDYTLADNTVVTLNAEQMTQVGLLLGEREQQVRNKATDLRTQIDACTTKEQVEAITW